VPIGLGDVNVTAAGDLRLRKAYDSALRVTGEVRTTRGTYEFQGREFSLDRGGTIRFVGTEDINPLLDVTASRTVSAVEARVHIGGTLEEPTVSLSSSPPLEQADILSLIVFNRPVNELGAGEQVALTRRAAAMAAGVVASELTSALDNVLGVDLLDIEAATVDGVLAPAVTIGQQFGDLFVQVRQQFGPASPSRFVIEYRVTDWFRIESAIVDRESGSGPLLRRSEGTGIDAVFSFRR
jgi:translocation and assembly module TamB